MIDAEGFRPNVGIIIANDEGQVLWARRNGHEAWQFPQGGINAGESPEQAMYRELWEEVGLEKQDVRILAQTRGWLRYRLPRRYVRHDSAPVCIGQKQKWFLLKLAAKPDGTACARPRAAWSRPCSRGANRPRSGCCCRSRRPRRCASGVSQRL